MPVPVGKLDPEIAAYLQELEDRLALREQAAGPFPVYACATAGMPAAADYLNCVLRNTTLNILAVSDGSGWVRQDTGAYI